MNQGRFEDALVYAATVHRNQVRKKTQIPYVSHLLIVAGTVLEYGGDEDEAIAALLHDAAEDCGGRERLDDIRDRFGTRVADIVEGCSDSLAANPREKEPWAIRKARYVAQLRETTNASVLLVSAADKLHNARATLADTRRVGPAVWDRFNASREDVLRYYGSLIEAYEFASMDLRVDQLAAELRLVVAELAASGQP